jgi:hypothetical protein
MFNKDALFHQDNYNNDVVYDNNEDQVKLAVATETDTGKYLSGLQATLPVMELMQAEVTDMTDTGKSVYGVPATLPVIVPMPLVPSHLPPMDASGLKTAEIWICENFDAQWRQF